MSRRKFSGAFLAGMAAPFAGRAFGQTVDDIRSAIRSLARLAGNRLSALLTGAVIMTIVQSSSVTSVIAIGFVSAGIVGVPSPRLQSDSQVRACGHRPAAQ